MDVGVDPNAKYAIMCRKTILIPEDNEEFDTFGSSATVSLTIEIFSEERAKR